MGENKQLFWMTFSHLFLGLERENDVFSWNKEEVVIVKRLSCLKSGQQ